MIVRPAVWHFLPIVAEEITVKWAQCQHCYDEEMRFGFGGREVECPVCLNSRLGLDRSGVPIDLPPWLASMVRDIPVKSPRWWNASQNVITPIGRTAEFMITFREPMVRQMNESHLSHRQFQWTWSPDEMGEFFERQIGVLRDLRHPVFDLGGRAVDTL